MVSEATRHVMQANKSKNTKPELKVRAALREAGLSGYRIHWKKAPGSPDICYPGRKLAIFVNGCFWHSCPYCTNHKPKTNQEFWTAKFERNRARDERDQSQLVAAGWTVLVVWECRLKRANFAHSMGEVVREVERAGQGRTARPDFCWPEGGRVIEIGTSAARRHRKVSREIRLRHSRGSAARGPQARSKGRGRR